MSRYNAAYTPNNSDVNINMDDPGNSKCNAKSIRCSCGTKKIDYVVAFPLENDVNYETLPKVVHYCKIIEGKGLETVVQIGGQTKDGKVVFIKIHAPWKTLARHAELMKIKMPMSWLHKQKKRKPTLWNEPSLISSWIRRKIPDPFAFNKDIVQPKSKYDNFAFEMEKEKLFTEISEKCKEEYFSNATRSRIVHEILDNDQITTFPGSSENEYDGVRSVVHQIMKKKRCTDADLRKIVHQIMKQKSCTVEDLRRSVHQIMEKKLCTDEDLRRIVHEILDKEQITTVTENFEEKLLRYDCVKNIVREIMKKKRCSDEDLRRIVHEILDNDPLIDEDLTTVHGILENDDFIDLDLTTFQEILDNEKITTVHESLDKKLLKNDGISSIIVRESLENKRFTYGGLSSIVCLIMKNTPHKDKDLRRIVHEILDKEQIKTLHQILDNKRCTDGDLRRIDLESLERNHFTYDDLSRIVHASLEGGKITDDILIKIAHQILENDRCTDKVLSMIVNEILKNIRNTIQAGRNITRDQNVNILDNKKVPAYPLHDGDWKVDKPYYARNDRQVLYEDWARPNNFYKKQPLHLVRNYFGERVALYFSWLGYYTIMLTFAAIFGVVTFLLACVTLEYNVKVNEICDRNGTGSIIMCPSCDQDCDYSHLSSRCMYAKLTYLFDNGATIFFASFMSLWATVFCEFWKRHEKTTACEWDAIGYEETEENCRPQLERSIETTRISPVTGAEEPYVHYWVRFRRYIISFIMILFLIMLSLIAVVAIILYRISVNVALTLDKDSKNEGANTSLITTITASILSIVAILILQEFYQRIVVLLTKLELHRTETEYEDSLIFKYYLVSFFNFYSSSFYIAFVKGKLPGDPHSYGRIFGYRQEECDVSGCMQELFIHIATIMCVKQFLGNFQELGWPVIRNRIRSYRFRKTNAKNVSESEQYEKDYDLSSISSLGLLHEYLEMAIQFGFTTIFVAAFPLAPFFALLNNLIEIRLDAYKILTQCRRKYAARAEDIGSWYIILSAIGNLSVLTNALIIAFTSEFIPQTVYQTYYGGGELAGYMEFSLSVFNVSNFENGSAPVNSSLPNVTECRYRGYNTGPNLPYDHTKDYWLIIARKLLFVLFFEHIIFLIKIAMAFVIPDVPEDVRDQMKREKYLDYKVRRIKVMA